MLSNLMKWFLLFFMLAVAVPPHVEAASKKKKSSRIGQDDLIEICRRHFKVYIYSASRLSNGQISCKMYYSETLNGERGGNYNGRDQKGRIKGTGGASFNHDVNDRTN